MPKQSIACPSCKQGRIYINPTPYRVINEPEFSIIAMAHEKPINCPKCNLWFVPIFDKEMI